MAASTRRFLTSAGLVPGDARISLIEGRQRTILELGRTRALIPLSYVIPDLIHRALT